MTKVTVHMGEEKFQVMNATKGSDGNLYVKRDGRWWRLSNGSPSTITVGNVSYRDWRSLNVGMPKEFDPKNAMVSRAVRTLQSTWQAIGSDVLACSGNPERITLNAEDVREAVSTCGFVGGYPMNFGQDKEAVK